MSKAKENKEKDIQLSAEEQEAIAQRRALLAKIETVENEVMEVLKKHNADLGIDPQSPFGAPRIVVKLL